VVPESSTREILTSGEEEPDPAEYKTGKTGQNKGAKQGKKKEG
jgi:hypothetical protein